MTSITLAGGGELFDRCHKIIKNYQATHPGIVLNLTRKGETLDYYKQDILFSAGYDRLVGSDLLNHCLCINLHLSPLPKYGGFNPVYWAIIRGEREWAVTIHKMAEEFDTGDIIYQRFFEIMPEDTARTLYDRAVIIAGEMFSDNLENIVLGKFRLTKQDITQRSFFRKKDADFGRAIVLSTPELRARIFPPFPNPIVVIGGKRYTLSEEKKG